MVYRARYCAASETATFSGTWFEPVSGSALIGPVDCYELRANSLTYPLKVDLTVSPPFRSFSIRSFANNWFGDRPVQPEPGLCWHRSFFLRHFRLCDGVRSGATKVSLLIKLCSFFALAIIIEVALPKRFSAIIVPRWLNWTAQSRGLALERGANNVGPLSPVALQGLRKTPLGRAEMRFAHLKTHHRFERMRLRGLFALERPGLPIGIWPVISSTAYSGGTPQRSGTPLVPIPLVT